MTNSTLDDTLQVPDNEKVNVDILKANELMVERTLRQKELADKFQAELQIFRANLKSKEGSAVRDGFLQKIRRWYNEYREVNGKFPDMPPEEEGGSILIYNTPIVPVEQAQAAGAIKKVIHNSFLRNASQMLISIARP